jgi:murein biosynthesis integral membrane protein MurJ
VIGAFRGRLSAVHDNHKRIASGALTIGLLTLAAKVFVAAREMSIAWRYGVSATVDAYQLAITITTWLPMLIVGVMTVVLVPRLVSLHRLGDERSGFLGELNGTVLLLGAGISLLTWIAAPFAALLLASGVNGDTVQMTATLAAQLAPLAFCILVCGYFSARLQSRQRFIYSITEAAPALLIALILVAPLGIEGILPLIVGTLAGYGLQVLILAAMVKQGDPPFGGLRINHRSAEWQTLYGALSLMVVAQLMITLANPIDQAFAARLGEGAVATLGYATRIVTLLTGLGSVVVGRALLPVLSHAVAEGSQKLGARQTLQWSGALAVAAAVGAAIMWLLAPLLVRLLFQRGAFDAAATANVAHVLRFGLVQLPFYFAGMAMVQFYAATGRYRAILAITASALVLKVALNATLAPMLGVAGIALSTAAMYFLTATLLGLGMRR